MTTPVVETVNLRKTYMLGKVPVEALRGVNLKIEIGILKALGMKNRTVLLIFLSEAMIVGVMGAVIGIASGWVSANIVARVFSGGGGFMQAGNQAATTSRMTITPILTPTVFLGAFAFGVVVSVVFALYPAWRASKLKPVEALRYE